MAHALIVPTASHFVTYSIQFALAERGLQFTTRASNTFEIPLLQLRGELSSVPALAAWQAAEPENKYNLPSFSAYPQAYATAAGEYLMMLPQMLESLYASSGVDGEQQPGIDADWLDKVYFHLLKHLSLCITFQAAIHDSNEVSAEAKSVAAKFHCMWHHILEV